MTYGKAINGIFYLVFLLQSQLFYGQSATVSLGQSIGSSEGSVSYSIGQIAFTSYSEGGISINEGVQQPFEILLSSLISNHSENIFARVYPNPALHQIRVEIIASHLTNAHFTITDLQGRSLTDSKAVPLSKWINLRNLEPGMYVLTIYTPEERPFNIQFIKI